MYDFNTITDRVDYWLAKWINSFNAFDTSRSMREWEFQFDIPEPVIRIVFSIIIIFSIKATNIFAAKLLYIYSINEIKFLILKYIVLAKYRLSLIDKQYTRY